MIKNRLKVLLAERDMSQRQLADLLGAAPTTVNRFAHQNHEASINGRMLDDVCRVLGVRVGDVFVYAPDDDSAES